MKKNILEFIRRGLTACGLGPMVLVIIYLLLYRTTGIETLNIHDVCRGILSLSALAFIAGGMNTIYQIEQLPLMVAILIHGGILYFCYLGTYLLNGWLEWGEAPILIFSVIFILSYLAIWAIIYSITKNRTIKLNEKLRQKQQHLPRS